ncbi:MAG: glycosyltransferase family 9 protein [Candidatus Omnitrophica bacterium]|nr:glycosyltransferase family 9 protein [Candidatus Omnitrophota bacterium]
MELKGINKIIIFNLGGIGDLLLSFPAVKALRQTYPGASIDIVVVERVKELALDLGLFSDVLVYRKNFLADLSLFVSLGRKGYDLGINMRTIVSFFSALKIFTIMALVHPKISAGRDTDHHGLFFDIKIPETLYGEKHDTEYDIDLVTALGAKVTDRKVVFDIDGKSKQQAMKKIADNGITGNDIVVGINAGGVLSHRWPLDNFEAVIKDMAGFKDVKFVLTGDASEAKYVDPLRRSLPDKVINLSGKLNLRELAAVIKRCSIYITNDTGPMHIAASLNVPLLAIFGPGYIKRFDPRAISDKAKVFYKAQDCAPCDRIRCVSTRCLKAITPQEVSREARNILSVM